MSGHSRRSGAFSPPISSTLSYVNGQQSKLYIVSRLAIEGKAKQGEDGASIRLFLKLSIPIETVSSGMIVPLFAEENIKLRGHQIHPIDSNSAPYNFSSSECPLIHNAARALNLPGRSTKSYLSLFDPSHVTPARHPSTSRTSHANGSVVPPLDEKYTGTIIISGYNVSYVLPREFPPKINITNLDSDDDRPYTGRSTAKAPNKRRGSVIEKNFIQFVAGVHLWVPFLSKPPKAPYLLSIPIPRCLSNTISVRIFPPRSTSASFASLSSEEEPSGWDLTTDPHVTRSSTKHSSRSNVYNHFADDESSDSSVTGFADGCGIQGTFPSTEYVRIRWASPLNTWGVPDQTDGRRRVGVNDVRGEMTCTVLGPDPRGIKIRLNYQGTCKGVWFPGVATLLGMDVGLDAQGCDVLWPANQDGRWQVDGEAGFTGFDVGSPSRGITREPSVEFPQVTISDSSPLVITATHAGDSSLTPSRSSSIASSSSLLRAPLPSQSSQEYSFESTPTPSISDLPSSVSSLTPSSVNASGVLSPLIQPPSVPITLHLNMNDIAFSGKNTFTFNISGIVVVSPLDPIPPDYDNNSVAIPIPMFRVLTAESEVVSITIRSRCDTGIVEVHEPLNRHSAARRSILKNGAQHKCSTEKPEVIWTNRSATNTMRDEPEEIISPPSRPRTPNSITRANSQPIIERKPEIDLIPKYRNGPLIIPWVSVTVFPLARSGSSSYVASAVKLCLPAPVDGPSNWLEFGLAMPPSSEVSFSDSVRKSTVEIASASLAGIPVRFETFGQSYQESDVLNDLNVDGERKREWLIWVRIYTAGNTGDIEIVYTVEPRKEASGVPLEIKGKTKVSAKGYLNAFLPLFSIPVGRMEVTVEKISGCEITFQSSMPYRQDMEHCTRFFDFSVEPFHHMDLLIKMISYGNSTRWQSFGRSASRLGLLALTAVPLLLSISSFNHTISMRRDLRIIKNSLDAYSSFLGPEWNNINRTMSSASTLLTSTEAPTSPIPNSEKWWLTDSLPTKEPDESISNMFRSDEINKWEEIFMEEIEVEDSDDAFGSAADASHVLGEVTSLIPILSFAWPPNIRIEMTQILARVMTVTDRIWKVLQLAFHWPLIPDN